MMNLQPPPKKICVLTASRAEYGLLQWVMRAIADEPGLTLQVAVTGSHLAKQFGETWRAIEDDGFHIDAKVDMELAGREGREEGHELASICRSAGLATAGLGEVFARLQPDVLVVLGDRYEILAAALAATIARVPIAHIAGGDVTEGAFDDAIRHAVTKLSHLHFVTNQPAAERVAQMGGGACSHP